jgi:hypothetical protein
MRLDDPRLLAAYRSEFPNHAAPDVLCELLEHLAQKPYASSVYAITSLQHLRFGTVPYEQSHPLDPHVSVSLWKATSPAKAYSASVSFVARGERKSSAGRLCHPDELPMYADLYLQRLLLDELHQSPPA